MVVRTVAELRATIAAWRREGDTIGLVPTMGALHEGHRSLIRRAKECCARSVVTIFVNPRQFGPREDLAAYPRDAAGDIAKARSAGADLVFLPEVAEMYPAGFATNVSVAGLSEGLCGGHRPGHFDGVATVVTKLLLQALPDRAFFGEKDYQQLMVIKRLARDLDIPVAIEGVPTVREADGLALSSRNLYLSPEERRIAPALARIMQGVAVELRAGAVAERVLARGIAELRGAGFTEVEYFELRDAETLDPVTLPTRPARLLAAVRLGRTRLIDNVPVETQVEMGEKP